MSLETIERLLVTVEGSTELLRQELKKGGVDVDRWARDTEQRVGRVDSSFRKVASTLRTTLAAFGIGLSTTAVVNFTRSQIAAADAVGETARAADIGAERFQRLRFVFRSNGVEAKEFDAAMRTANTRLGQFITTGAGPAAKAIEQLGLKQRIANGEIRTNEQFVDAIIEALGRVPSAAERAALAAAIFGREAGAKMQETLGKGTDAINEHAKAATGIFSDETVRKADELGEAYERIASAAKTWAGSIVIAAAHKAGLDLGIEGLTGGDPNSEKEVQAREDERIARLLEVQRRRQQVGFDLDEQQAKELADLQAAVATRGRFRTGETMEQEIERRQRDATGELGDIKVTAQRREVMRSMPISPFSAEGISEIQVPGRIQMPKGFAPRAQMAEVSRDFEESKRRAEEYAEAVEKARDRQQRFADAIAASFESRGFEALLSGKPRDAIRGLAQDFAELVLRLTILQPLAEKLAGSLSGIGAGNGVGKGLLSIFGFADGGRPPVGQASWVGEKGRELFVPDVPGRIYSHAQSMRMAAAGGGIVVNNENHIETGLAPTLDAQFTMYGHAIAQATFKAVMAKLGKVR